MAASPWSTSISSMRTAALQGAVMSFVCVAARRRRRRRLAVAVQKTGGGMLNERHYAMIARIWRGQATADNARHYRRHATKCVFPSLAGLPGHQGAYLLRRETGGQVELLAERSGTPSTRSRHLPARLPRLPWSNLKRAPSSPTSTIASGITRWLTVPPARPHGGDDLTTGNR
jgi:hypothetical protein